MEDHSQKLSLLSYVSRKRILEKYKPDLNQVKSVQLEKSIHMENLSRGNKAASVA